MFANTLLRLVGIASVSGNVYCVVVIHWSSNHKFNVTWGKSGSSNSDVLP